MFKRVHSISIRLVLTENFSNWSRIVLEIKDKSSLLSSVFIDLKDCFSKTYEFVIKFDSIESLLLMVDTVCKDEFLEDLLNL